MKQQSGAEAQQRYDEVAAGLADAGVVRGTMFGMPSLKIGTKVLGGLRGDAMTFKLPEHARERALALPGAELFDPGMGRPMKEWVIVPVSEAAAWPGLAEAAMEYVRA